MSLLLNLMIMKMTYLTKRCLESMYFSGEAPSFLTTLNVWTEKLLGNKQIEESKWLYQSKKKDSLNGHHQRIVLSGHM